MVVRTGSESKSGNSEPVLGWKTKKKHLRKRKPRTLEVLGTDQIVKAAGSHSPWLETGWEIGEVAGRLLLKEDRVRRILKGGGGREFPWEGPLGGGGRGRIEKSMNVLLRRLQTRTDTKDAIFINQ